MPKANADPNTSPEPADECGRIDAQHQQPEEQSKFPLSDIETELTRLHAMASLVGHLATSDFEVDTEILNHIEDQLSACHERMKTLWHQAFEEVRREHKAHEAALAAAKARTAPGSQAEAERVGGLWGLLTGAAQVVMERAREAMPEGTRALVGDAEALRHAVAPIDAGLPPAESGRA